MGRRGRSPSLSWPEEADDAWTTDHLRLMPLRWHPSIHQVRSPSLGMDHFTGGQATRVTTERGVVNAPAAVVLGSRNF